jgi:hypothetical protein
MLGDADFLTQSLGADKFLFVPLAVPKAQRRDLKSLFSRDRQDRCRIQSATKQDDCVLCVAHPISHYHVSRSLPEPPVGSHRAIQILHISGHPVVNYRSGRGETAVGGGKWKGASRQITCVDHDAGCSGASETRTSPLVKLSG